MKNEIVKFINTEEQTPLEILLGIDEYGRTTAKKLYEFLELDKSHYSRWCKKNIVENPFAEENIDFWAFAINGEWGGQASNDYKLTASFAKKLAMSSKSLKGEQAREYFIKVENKLKELARVEKFKVPSTYKEALKELIVQIEENEKLEEKANRLEIELDCNKQWYTIKRVAYLNGVNWKNISWSKLKMKSEELGFDVIKIFDANYGYVNSYHYYVWKTVYPEYDLI